MKKYQYIVAATCIIMGAAGFAGIYAVDQLQQDEKQEEQTPIDLVDIGDVPKEEVVEKEKKEEDTLTDFDLKPEETAKETPKETEIPVAAPKKEEMHFSPEKGIVWPIEGTVLLDYSMDASIFFPTLNQYQYHPAMVIKADVNSKVYFVAKGRITDVSTNEVTGCTVTQDLGDGYTVVYGQLKELNFKSGDVVEAGQVVGYVGEPTKYYAVEGSNVYFQLQKDGVPMDPKTLLTE